MLSVFPCSPADLVFAIFHLLLRGFTCDRVTLSAELAVNYSLAKL